MEDITYRLKHALPNKSVNDDGTITDIFGNPVFSTDEVYDSKPALPNKWINADGTYSTLQEILAQGVDTDIFIPVETLPDVGNPKKIYLVPDGKGHLIEYHYHDGKWDQIGMVEFDLSKYSTTDEMIQAINSACLSTLASANAYTDEKIGEISTSTPVLYWNDGFSSATPELLEFWDNVITLAETQDVLVMVKNVVSGSKYYYVPYVFNSVTFPSRSPLKTMYPSTIMNDITNYNNYSSVVLHRWRTLVFHFDMNKNLTNVTENEERATFKTLDLDTNYKTPYEPKYDGSPATKKYVDDSIKTNITDVLGGEY